MSRFIFITWSLTGTQLQKNSLTIPCLAGNKVTLSASNQEIKTMALFIASLRKMAITLLKSYCCFNKELLRGCLHTGTLRYLHLDHAPVITQPCRPTCVRRNPVPVSAPAFPVLRCYVKAQPPSRIHRGQEWPSRRGRVSPAELINAEEGQSGL